MGSTDRISPRRVPRQARAKVTRDAILEAGAQLLRGAELAAFTTDRIAEVAGVSIGTLYQYFPNKDAVLVGLAERELARMGELLIEYAARLGDSPEALVESYVRACTEVHAREARLHRVLIEELPRLTSLERVRDYNDRAVAVVRDFLARYSADGRDLDAAAYVIFHATRGVVFAHLTEAPAIDRERFTRELVRLVTAYVRAECRALHPRAARAPRRAARAPTASPRAGARAARA